MTEYVQCPNCDYICTKEELVKHPLDTIIVCPSCSDEYWQPDWSDPRKYRSDEQITAQLAWQKEVLQKGAAQALADNFLRKKEK